MTRKFPALLVLFSGLSSCQQTGKQLSSTGSLAQRVAELEAKESKSKVPDSRLADEAKGLAFSGDLAKSLEKALRQDIPKAVLELKAIATTNPKGPNAKQKQWLEAQGTALTPEALAILEQAFADAVSVLDLRGMLIASTVAERIKKDGIQASERTKEVKNRVLAGTPARVYWSVTKAAAVAIGESYNESSGFGGYASVTAKPGTHLLRVSATIKNVSAGRDSPYTLGIFEGLKGAVAGMVPDRTANGVTIKGEDALAGPHRWLDDSLIFLVESSGDFIKCGFVTEGSGLRGPGTMSVSGIGVITAPQLVRPNEDISFDGIFPVPNGSQEFKLLVMGAAPVSIRETQPAKAQ